MPSNYTKHVRSRVFAEYLMQFQDFLVFMRASKQTAAAVPTAIGGGAKVMMIPNWCGYNMNYFKFRNTWNKIIISFRSKPSSLCPCLLFRRNLILNDEWKGKCRWQFKVVVPAAALLLRFADKQQPPTPDFSKWFINFFFFSSQSLRAALLCLCYY